MKIAFLGLGKMGSAVARRLVQSGRDLTVWNRTCSAAEALLEAGATVAATATEAVSNAEVVFTMLNDDLAVEQVILANGSLNSMRPGAIHVSLSTISIKLSRRLVSEHEKAGSDFVAAPVFGRPNVAADGKLWIVIGGKEASVATIRPLLEPLSRGVTLVSEDPWRANALKIGGNYLITAMIESLSESMNFAQKQGIDPELFLDAVNSALFRSPLYETYGKVMLHPPEHPGATINLGVKDMELFRDAAIEADLATPLADHFAADLKAAQESGLGNLDWAAGLYRFAQGSKPRTS
jgi:3-hydroxyisobutyrate dehydrogenase-like beta-hydroxyacid dehydrogenase